MGVENRDHLQSIQLLRAAAALAVVLFHLTFPLEVEFGVLPANAFVMGSDGVDVFFVISGFIMAYTTAREDQRSASQFMWKRLVRILPLYWVLTLAVFAIGVIAPALLNSGAATWEDLGKSLAFIPYERADGRIAPVLFLGWTLNYEMFFYVVFAIGLMFAPRWRLQFVVGAITTVAIIGYLAGNKLGLIGKFYTDGIILEFAAGCVLFAAWQARPGLFRWAVPVAALGLSLLIYQNFVEIPLPRELKKGIPALMIVAGALKLSVPSGAVTRFWARVGDASYSLYLGHPYAIALSVKLTVAVLGAGLLGAIVAGAMALTVSIGAALLSFYLLERPANNLLRGLVPPRRAAVPVASQPAAE